MTDSNEVGKAQDSLEVTAVTAPASRKRASNPARGAKPGERRGGRAPGTPNKVTADIRQSINQLLEQAAPLMPEWLTRVAAEDPGKALDLALRAAEYCIPKHSRLGISVGDDGSSASVIEVLLAARARVNQAEIERSSPGSPAALAQWDPIAESGANATSRGDH